MVAKLPVSNPNTMINRKRILLVIAGILIAWPLINLLIGYFYVSDVPGWHSSIYPIGFFFRKFIAPQSLALLIIIYLLFQRNKV